MPLWKALALACCAGCATSAHAQVVLNELFENPPGSGSIDEVWEYIEIYGEPGMSLTGYAVALVKGGRDVNGDNIPDGVSRPEVDEAFSLDGLHIGPNGFLVIAGVNAFGESQVGNFLTPNPNYNPFLPDSLTNRRWLDGISKQAAHIPAGDTVGNFSDDGSSTYILVRKRPNHSINGSGQSVYGPGYVWRKDNNPDVNFDGKFDFGIETPLPGSPVARVFDPYQMVDDMAWSNSGGKEYVRSSQNEISETDGFNPDAVSRLRYFAENPMLGHRTRTVGSSFEILPTRIADESWIYGELTQGQFPSSLAYNNGVDAQGFKQVKAPTDRNATPYTGACDPEPDGQPGAPGCAPSPAGTFYFTDLNVQGFALTPGAFNDHPTNPNLQQFRFVRGDFNFDGEVTGADLSLIQSRIGATLDDTIAAAWDNNTPDNPNDDFAYTAWKWQGAEFQQVLMMINMVKTDGPGGANAPQVTQQDADAVAALLPSCPGDTNGDLVVDFADLNAVLGNFNQSGPGLVGDFDNDGDVDFGDLNVVLSAFNQPC
ncbi:MAG: hypothetical protein IBJ10_08760 [Phycisphaerales bacterium]|nr:hypothetical protein [Phycisphaerales bacterium]